MDSGDDGVSGSDPGTGGTGDRTEAVQPSPDSPEPSSGRRESKRRIKAAVTSPDSGDSRSDTGGPVRVLRARGPVAGRTDESKSATCQKKTESLHRGRGRPAGSRSKSAPVVYTTEKKSTSKKASKCTLGPKLSKSRKGNQRPLTRAPRTTAAAAAATTTTACKPEAEIEPSSCGEEASTLNGSDSVADPDATLHEDSPLRVDDITDDVICQPETTTEKSRRQALLQQEEVKKEESDKDEEENDIKTEESPEVTLQSEDEVEDNTEPPRKRGRQQKDDKTPRPPKRRKKPPVQYVRCEIEGCGTVLAHPRYLQHHIKYQHLLKKKYVCDHPSCGRLFRLQKQLLRHAKHHTDQRDYICEFCARAFKSSHNLAVHRMIHTGEKPIQCEICGFTCRQKASLNWHMKKHDAEASYQFSCSICNRKFEKKDSVVAHKAKSHPEVLIAEAMAANGGSVINCPTSIPETVSEIVPETLPETISEAVSEAVSETVPMLTSVDQPSISQDTQKAMSSTLTPLQQVVLPLAPQTQINVSQGQFLQLPTHHVVRVGHEQQTPTLLHLTTSPPAQLSNTSHQQLIQLSTFPANTVTPMASAYPQSTLLTLSSVTTLASTANMGPQQAVQWGRETDEDVQLPGEGELWDRVVVGDSHQDVGEMMWEGNSDRRKEDEGIVWERESERQILLQCTEVQGDSLM